jgi:phosphotransferase system  glucose/maltose/N-acetylglucosamine-specific IIC component
MSIANLSSLVKIGAYTFAGAFAGAIVLTKLPTTADDWKTLLVPALAAGVAAELTFLKGQLATFLNAEAVNAGGPTEEEIEASKKS